MLVPICFSEATVRGGFHKINMENLAYEIKFMKGYSVQTLKDAGLNVDTYITEGEDERLVNVDESEENRHRIMLHEGNGEKENAKDVLLSEIDNMSNGKLKYVVNSDGTIDISFKEGSGSRQDLICTLVACCSSCHRLIHAADDYFIISLLGDTSAGKTTFIESLIVDDFDKLCDVGDDWEIIPISTHRKYQDLVKGSKAMLKGIVPPNTDTMREIEPLLFRLNYTDIDGNTKSMIIVLVDNAGERVANLDNSDPRTAMILHSDASIYMIDKKQLKLPKESEKDEVCLLPPLEQIEIKNDREAVTYARELVGDDLENEEDPLSIYRALRGKYGENNMLDKFQNHHIAFCVTKCDSLKQVPEIMDDEEFREYLFNDIETAAMVDDDYMLFRETVMERFFEKYVFDKKELRIINKGLNGRRPYSFHAIAALGCDVVKESDDTKHMVGRYSPINVAEPLIYLLKKKIG